MALFPTDGSDEHKQTNLINKINRIEDRLELILEQILHTQEEQKASLETIRNEKHDIQTQEQIIDEIIESIEPETIPKYKEVKSAILNLMNELDLPQIKDWVITQHLGKQYSRAVVWAVLEKMLQQNEMKLSKAGIWTKND
jgi:hypothetical protein